MNLKDKIKYLLSTPYSCNGTFLRGVFLKNFQKTNKINPSTFKKLNLLSIDWDINFSTYEFHLTSNKTKGILYINLLYKIIKNGEDCNDK